jgi:diguanylate cyclase (GGDEF)-like protein
LDIDGFTTLNETMGHLAGGALLRVLARRIQGVVEKDMLLARVGADEFAVLVHRANPRRLDRLAVSLKESVSKQPFELGEPFGTVDISVTVGYASGDELAGRKTKKRILERARDAVRQGRKRGGDCMVKAE